MFLDFLPVLDVVSNCVSRLTIVIYAMSVYIQRAVSLVTVGLFVISCRLDLQNMVVYSRHTVRVKGTIAAF